MAFGPSINQIIRRIFNATGGPVNTESINVKVVSFLLGSGVSATATNTRPTVTSTSSTILASNTDRKFADVYNQMGAVMYIKLGATAVVGEGYRLVNNDVFHVPEGYTGAVNAIRGAGSGSVEVVEGT